MCVCVCVCVCVCARARACALHLFSKEKRFFLPLGGESGSMVSIRFSGYLSLSVSCSIETLLFVTPTDYRGTASFLCPWNSLGTNTGVGKIPFSRGSF